MTLISGGPHFELRSWLAHYLTSTSSLPPHCMVHQDCKGNAGVQMGLSKSSCTAHRVLRPTSVWKIRSTIWYLLPLGVMCIKSGLWGSLRRREGRCSSLSLVSRIRWGNFSLDLCLGVWSGPLPYWGPPSAPSRSFLPSAIPPLPHLTPSRARPAPQPAGFQGRLARQGHGHSAARSCGAKRAEKAGCRGWAGNCREVVGGRWTRGEGAWPEKARGKGIGQGLRRGGPRRCGRRRDRGGREPGLHRRGEAGQPGATWGVGARPRGSWSPLERRPMAVPPRV